MVNVKNNSCRHHGCNKQTNYGVEGTREAAFCSGHRRDGMVDVNNRRCSHQGCTKVPSYGVEDSSKAEFCSNHRRDGMVDVKHLPNLRRGR